MSTKISIVPAKIELEYDSLELSMNYVLNTDFVKVPVVCKKGEDVISMAQHVIDGKEYQSWTGSDDYIIDIICSRFNVTKV